MDIKIKRAYDEPEKSDGARVLVDRLWPRGVSKEEANVKEWLKDLTPSKELREWYHENKEKRFAEFKKRYKAELRAHKAVRDELQQKYENKTVTLITANKDIEHSHVPTLLAFLRK